MSVTPVGGFLWIVTVHEYPGPQYVGVDLHRRRSVIVRMTLEGDRLGPAVRIDNDPFTLTRLVAGWGERPEVVLEATYGWYWRRTCWQRPVR